MRILILTIALVACAAEPPVSPRGAPELEPTTNVWTADDASHDAVRANHYPDAQSWCHEVDDVPPCNPTGGRPCGPDPNTGRRRVCVDPWWVPGHERLCVPARLSPHEQRQALRELAALTRAVCEPRNGCDPERLVRLLALVSQRESSHDHQRTHLLNADLTAAWAAYRHRRAAFAHNPHYYDWRRWRSRGAYGTNPALHLDRWDPQAPPEVLCHRVVATEVYLATLRSCHRKLRKMRGADPDWWDLHECASGGSFQRPDPLPDHKGSFVARAQKVGLDPTEPVPAEHLGKPIPHTPEAAAMLQRRIARH